ncbi:MAG: cation-efflux pump, partial [Verrucomicrobiae bacterium]|nr:cation-efflux pump [Verrucomicrobiae bacterium]
GPGYESADDFAALVACGIIGFNGWRLLRTALDEIMDAAVPRQLDLDVRKLSAGVPGVVGIEKCRIRKSGLGYLVDIHVEVDGDMPVKLGHEIAHEVGQRLKLSNLKVKEVLVHIEPAAAAVTKEKAPDPK